MRALALLIFLLVPAAAAAPPSRVIDSESVGSYRLHQPRSRAIAAFGAPTISVDAHDLNFPQGDQERCRTFWKSLKLVITYAGPCSFAGRSLRVTVEGAAWRTREGLRVGDPVRLHRLYRGARVNRTPGDVTPLGVEWDLRRARPSSSVIVASQSGRVVGFELRRR